MSSTSRQAGVFDQPHRILLAEPHDAFVSLARSLICWRRLEKHRS
ncbi:hypothetical protein [Streptomyces europaeiscabiei]|nr:hypothetical protein [Streptomyces europaeiscabiei]MDX2529653.1 hypothetical protein [Streptomyces europaeiscabiei]MDX3782675.1 hypothetical protein [Streptomyces europaeiscabiei]